VILGSLLWEIIFDAHFSQEPLLLEFFEFQESVDYYLRIDKRRGKEKMLRKLGVCNYSIFEINFQI